MKIKRFVIWFVLISVFVGMCGCKDRSQDEFLIQSEMRRYMADACVSLENGKVATNLKKNGDVYYLSYVDMNTGKEHINIYDDQWNFQSEMIGDFEELNQEYYRLSAFNFCNDSLYLVFMDEQGLENRELIQYDLNGKERNRITIDAPKEIWDARVLEDVYITEDNIVLISGVGIQICDHTGKTIKEIYGTNKDEYYIDASDISSDGYLYYSFTEDYIPCLAKVEILTGENRWTQKFEFGDTIRNISVDRENGKVYFINDSNIQLVDETVMKITTVGDIRDYNRTVNSDDASFYKNIFDLLVDGDELVYMYSDNKAASDVVCLLPDETEEKTEQIEKDGSVKLEIFLPYKDNIIDDILYSYEKENGVEISVEYYSDSFMNFNTEDYLQVVSTRILSGDPGWDIMSTEVIPYIQYSQKGYFADLFSLENGKDLKDEAKYFQNILTACMDGEALYFFPMSIEFLGIIGGAEDDEIISLQDILDKCTGNTQLCYVPEMNYANLFEYSFNNYCTTDYDGTKFDEDEYIKTAKLLKEIYNADIHSGAFSYTEGLVQILIEDLLHNSKNIDTYSSFRLLPLTDGANRFRMGTGYAIMNDSDMKVEALDLLMFISEHYDHRYGLNRENVWSKFDDIRLSYSEDPFGNKNVANADSYSEIMKNILASLDTLIYYDTDLYVLAYQQTLSYCKGEIDVEIAAERIKQAVDLFRNENT